MGALDGKVALITGAARGIGAGIATAFAKEGASVAVVDVLADEGTATVSALRELGADAELFECDIRDVGQITSTVDAVVARFGTVDVLVNNAIAVTGVGKHLQDVTDKEYELVFETGPRATFAFMRACHPHLKDGGRVINLRSGSEFQGLNGYSHYIAAKSAVGGLTRAAAREWGRDGITVNAIAPFSLSPAAAGWFEDKPDELATIVKAFAIPRPGDAELDIGRAAVYLASPDASYVTGQTLSVDGGAVFSA